MKDPLGRRKFYTLSQAGAIIVDDNVALVRVTHPGRITKVWGAMGEVTATLELNVKKAGTPAIVGTVAATTSGVRMPTLANKVLAEGDYLAMNVNAIGTTPIGAELTVEVEH